MWKVPRIPKLNLIGAVRQYIMKIKFVNLKLIFICVDNRENGRHFGKIRWEENFDIYLILAFFVADEKGKVELYDVVVPPIAFFVIEIINHEILANRNTYYDIYELFHDLFGRVVGWASV